MYAFFKKSFMVWFSIVSFQGSLMALEQYLVRPVDCNNKSEFEAVVNYYSKHRPYVDRKTKGKNHSTSYQGYLNNIIERVSESKHCVTFVCISQQTNKISGLLFFQYGYRRQYLAELKDFIINEDPGANEDADANEDILLALIQGAEKYFVQKSIKKIAVSVWSLKALQFYLKNGFYVMDSDAQAKDYWINMDTAFTVLGFVTVFPVLWKKLFYYGIVCKDIA